MVQPIVIFPAQLVAMTAGIVVVDRKPLEDEIRHLHRRMRYAEREELIEIARFARSIAEQLNQIEVIALDQAEMCAPATVNRRGA
jgi:hypothetical protein